MKNRNDKKIFVTNIIKTLSIILLVVCIWLGVLTIKENEFYRLSGVLILIFVDIILYFIMNLWKNWIIQEKCDFEAQEAYVISLLKQKRFKEKVSLHMELLFTSLVLGKYDESQQEMEELQRLDRRLNNMQRLQLQLWHIDYMISVNEMATLKRELENIEKSLAKLNGISDKVKQKKQSDIDLRKYIIEEQWENVLELLKNKAKLQRNMTVYEQISIAYIRGKCYFQLERYKEAFRELRFVTEWGGNTKYVTLANDLMEIVPEKNLYEDVYAEQSIKVKHKIEKEAIFLMISCFCVLLLSWFNYHYSHGNSIEEAYCRRYLCAEDELIIFYQKNIGDYELVILNEDEKIAYCLFKEVAESNYKIIDSFRIDKNVENNKPELMGIGMTESEKEFYQESEIKQELWAVITGFYKQNSIFYQGDWVYVGISFSSMVENITINGTPVSIEEITDINGLSVYLWRVENIDLKTNIRFDYEEQ